MKKISEMSVVEIVFENSRRRIAIREDNYNPLVGDSRDSSRHKLIREGIKVYVPEDMLDDDAYYASMSEDDFCRLRLRYDFEYWAARCVHITDKISGGVIPFVLNRPQRRLVQLLERQRRAGLPIRVIMLKARQWGGSTLVQVYFAWIQILHRRGWNSLICAHVKDTASGIRGMYTRLLENYPKELWDEEVNPGLAGFERTINTRVISGRDCKITICSSENQESTRGQDIALAHLSEVAYWKDTTLHRPEDLMRSLVSGIARKPLSAIVMESTANGVGNYFHREWLRATSPDEKSDKEPFFVPWYEISIYTEPVGDLAALVAALDDYERELWDKYGCTLEAVNWYRNKRREFPDHRSMMAEFPTTPTEAFASTGFNVFAVEDVDRLREEGCREADLRGDFDSEGRWFVSPSGEVEMWLPPQPGHDYIVAVDIGGRSRSADFSVILALDRSDPTDGRPEVAAQWHGHIDHDLLARKALHLARLYNNALLVVESNTWETQSEGRGQYILSLLEDVYDNLYKRPGSDGASKVGFHTNPQTKPAVIANLIALVRTGGYIEHSHGAANELTQYEALPSGAYAARSGCHDDLLMTRAIALWVDKTAPRPLSPQQLTALRNTYTPLLRRSGPVHYQ